jgi:hypothetical protein
MRWEFGSILPPEVKYNLCEPEVCKMELCPYVQLYTTLLIYFSISVLLFVVCFFFLFVYVCVCRNTLICFRFCGSINTVSHLQTT